MAQLLRRGNPMGQLLRRGNHLGTSPALRHPLWPAEADSAWPSFYVGITPWATWHLGASPSQGYPLEAAGDRHRMAQLLRLCNPPAHMLTSTLSSTHPADGPVLAPGALGGSCWPKSDLGGGSQNCALLHNARVVGSHLGPFRPRGPFLPKTRPPAAGHRTAHSFLHYARVVGGPFGPILASGALFGQIPASGGGSPNCAILYYAAY